VTASPQPAAPRPHASGFVDSADGVKLYHEIHHPPGGLAAARAALLIVHGYADHHGRYPFMRDHFLGAGFAVALFDYRGHGQSGGKRGHVYAFEEYHADLAAAIAEVRRETPALPLLLDAHSHGALITLHYALAHGGALPDVKATVLSSPFLALGMKVPAWKTVLGRGVSRVLPTFAMPNGIDAHDLTHDAPVVAAHLEDHLVGRKATARWFTECSRAQGEVLARAGEIALPYLLLVAGADRVVDPAAERRFHAAAGSADKTVVEYPALFHELHNETPPERARVFAAAQTWLDAHLA